MVTELTLVNSGTDKKGELTMGADDDAVKDFASFD